MVHAGKNLFCPQIIYFDLKVFYINAFCEEKQKQYKYVIDVSCHHRGPKGANEGGTQWVKIIFEVAIKLL